jgi:hypothetical protein
LISSGFSTSMECPTPSINSDSDPSAERLVKSDRVGDHGAGVDVAAF